ncbi:MAG TPA: EAL domain-containing protein [Aromatoleum sp.]|uniref:GGDEF/EAL domain-containing response regulator n=1 Tax=Aromatoleum sp. TaxID=2307007 RepID=UPI002B471F07|nr:EAL domain-containing protein [Aromatoleum sp.]HJV24355.1 EAL domain-containing protein [Aromatoleum sp.]
MHSLQNRRILVIDDTPAIHEDFRKILVDAPADSELDEVEAALFGAPACKPELAFELDSAYQGHEGFAKVSQALGAGRPYAMAFVDMRMPPGWDGVETIERLWQADPRLQIVICTAYSDYAWDEVLNRLDVGDRLLILKKPFDTIEVRQLADALTAKWQMTERAALKMADLDAAIERRTDELKQANDALKAEIDEHARAEAALKLAASVFENTMDGVLITDTAGTILSVNPAFTAITGYVAEEAIGRSPNLLRSDRHPVGFYRELWETLLREGRWEGEIWNRRKSGEAYLEWLSIGMVAGDDGRALRYVGVFNDITELRRKDEHIRHLAFHDPLTGLPNRALLLDRLEHGLAGARRAGERLGLMFIDLDRFKHINDSLGHDIGDALLQEVARRLRESVRQSDTVARMGGDEFVILLEQVGEPEVCAGLAKKILTRLNAPMELDGHTLQVCASIGIACFPDDGSDTVTLMKHADAAMYAAKSAGRGTYRFFQAEMTEKAGQRLRLEMELRSAVRKGELEVFYQPGVSLATGVPCGVEALVRWRHPERGLVPPNDFIPLAEETGIIHELGNWVLEEACRQSQAWREQGLGRIRTAVNISAKQLQEGDLAERIGGLTRKYGLAPGDLAVELTESVIMANPEEISGVFDRLREIGVTVAVDDFGTGYSSLAYLRRLPIDVLKIDRSFVRNADRDAGDAQIVRIIMALAQALKLDVIAEGVETRAQADFLASCGCETAQGFLFAQPQPAPVTAKWLQAHRAVIGVEETLCSVSR